MEATIQRRNADRDDGQFVLSAVLPRSEAAESDAVISWLMEQDVRFTRMRGAQNTFIYSETVTDPEIILLFRMRWVEDRA